MKKSMICITLFSFVALSCAHVPDKAVLVNPQTQQEVTLDRSHQAQAAINYIPWVGFFHAASVRKNQQQEIDKLKQEGYEVKWESKQNL